jgi:hypothetical protein
MIEIAETACLGEKPALAIKRLCSKIEVMAGIDPRPNTDLILKAAARVQRPQGLRQLQAKRL